MKGIQKLSKIVWIFLVLMVALSMIGFLLIPIL